MAIPRSSAEELAARGQRMYEREIRPKVEAGNEGRYLVIDLETGEYELDDDWLTAAMRAYRRNPGGVRYALRIGYDTVGAIGARLPRTQP